MLHPNRLAQPRLEHPTWRRAQKAMKFFQCPGNLRSSLVLPLAFALTLASLGTAAPASAATAQYAECESDFIAFVGSDVYQFSPALPADLGTVHLFSVLSYSRRRRRGTSA